jgi:catecholate siderophore receptor
MSERLSSGHHPHASTHDEITRSNTNTQQSKTANSAGIREAARKPLSQAAISIASMMLASGAAAQQSATTLPSIDVIGDVGTYQTDKSAITRLPTPLRDTPQTVNVIPQKVIQEQRTTTMEEALRSVPGITFNAGEGGQQGDIPIIRGFTARTDIFRDGVRDPGWYTRDLFSSDRVEVYKGPSAFAFGRGSTGGAVNIVSRLPSGATFLEGVASVSSAGGYRAEVDASGAKENVSGRIVAMGQDLDTPDRNNVWTRRWGVAPSISVGVNPQTKATFSYIYQGEEGIPDYGWPYLPQPSYSAVTGALTNPGYNGNGTAVTPVPIPRSNWFGVANGPLADVVKTQAHILTARLEHDLAANAKLSNITRYFSVDRFARVTSPRNLAQANNVTTPTPGYPVELMTIGRQHFQTETDNTLLVNQTDLTGKFTTGTLEHNYVLGLEVARETRFQRRASGMSANNLCDPTNILCRTSLWAPVDTAFGGVFTGWNPATETQSTSYAIYGFDQIKLNRYFELLAALRYDRFSTVFEDPGNATPANRHLERTDNLFSWRFGAVFHPTPNSSLYAAYGISYNPSAEFGTLSGSATSTANVALDPEKNRSIEIGAKADLLDGRLSLTGAIFRIEKTNLRILNDPSLPAAQQFLVLDGLARVDGFEVGIVGRITPAWQIFAGYSHLDAKIVETTNAAERGRQLPQTPPHSLALWTTYDLTPLWTIGGGATYQSDTFVNTTNTAYVPAFWRFDAMTSYKLTKNATLQLNVYNLTDEMYFAQYYAGHAVPASGRYATLSLRLRY